jgi:hypothetical protein
VRTVNGAETLEENLKFIADARGSKVTPREVIRGRFLNGFCADHCKIYQKRPMYWLFDGGKKNGFKALTYLHRCSRDMLAMCARFASMSSRSSAAPIKPHCRRTQCRHRRGAGKALEATGQAC